MLDYKGNISDHMDFDQLLSDIKKQQGDLRLFDPKMFDLADPGMRMMGDLWSRAGYDPSSIEWFNYYSGKHFDAAYTEKFSELFGCQPLKVWVSEIRPGKFFPRHWDVDTDVSSYEGKKLVRYHAHIQDYKFGQFFQVENQMCINYQKGDVYKWSSYDVWHGGGNIGMKPKYTFNYLGSE